MRFASRKPYNRWLVGLFALLLGPLAAWADGDNYAPGYDPVRDAVDTPTDEECLEYETGTTGKYFEWETCGGGGGTPAGSGSELQYRVDASTFGAVTGSSVSGAAITLAGDLALAGFAGTDITLTPLNGDATGLHAELSGASDSLLFIKNDTDFVLTSTPSALFLGSSGNGVSALQFIALHTDGTGNGEIRLPSDSIGYTELDTADDPADGESLTFQASSGRMVWAAGGSGNSFETVAVPAGTNPVADAATDTLTITETSPLVITGTAATDTIDITWTTLTVAEGGTGATTLTDGGILLGSGTGAITALGVATNGQIPIGDGTTDPVLATITGTADEITVTNGAGTITLDIPDPLIVGKGGSGAATFTDGGILLGSGTGAFTALGVATNGQLPIGDGTTDPVLATLTGTANEVTVTNGAGSITLDLPLNAGTDITADLEEDAHCSEHDSADVDCSGETIVLAANSVDDANLAINESINLPVYSAKLTGAFVVRTPTSGDASTQGAQIDAGDGNWRLLFDATTDEAAVWQLVLPDYWAAHSEVKIFYSMASATTLEVEFEVDVMCITPSDSADIGTASFAGVAVISGTVPGTAGFPAVLNATVTDDSCAAGDVMFVYLSTDANDATNDDATGDREVVGLAYEFTR